MHRLVMQRIVGAVTAVAAGSVIPQLVKTVHAEEKVTSPKYPWSHTGLFSSYDHASYTCIVDHQIHTI